MEQRLVFVVEWLKHECSMAELCRGFGISRQTGYELVAQYQAHGLDGLKPRSRAPHRHPNAIDEEVCAAVIRAKARHPSWGPKKLGPLEDEPEPIKVQWPVASTRGAILVRAGLVMKRRRPRPHVPAWTQPFGTVTGANDTWCADFKGWFRTGDGLRCDPLTISDAHSRVLLRCQALHHGVATEYVRPVFDAAFREYGLPLHVRTDNGQHRCRWPVKPGGVVDQAGHHPGAHRPRPTQSERSPRALPPHAQRSHRATTSGNHPRPAAALRCVSGRVQL
jgi:putative transposase